MSTVSQPGIHDSCAKKLGLKDGKDHAKRNIF